MQPVLLAQKGSSSQMYDAAMRRVPTTKLVVESTFLADIKTKEKDGYNALKFAFGTRKRIDKPTQGQLKKSGITTTPALVKEVRLHDYHVDRLSLTGTSLKSLDQEVAVGAAVAPAVMFKVGDIVDVTGVSKGKGFQGGVKRHRFAGGPKTHGQSDRWRAPGSMGATTTPGRTFKGQRMAGRMGNDTVTVRKLTVLEVTPDALVVSGLVPGTKGTLITVTLSK